MEGHPDQVLGNVLDVDAKQLSHVFRIISSLSPTVENRMLDAKDQIPRFHIFHRKQAQFPIQEVRLSHFQLDICMDSV
jgi:hypothetical protein